MKTKKRVQLNEKGKNINNALNAVINYSGEMIGNEKREDIFNELLVKLARAEIWEEIS